MGFPRRQPRPFQLAPDIEETRERGLPELRGGINIENRRRITRKKNGNKVRVFINSACWSDFL